MPQRRAGAGAGGDIERVPPLRSRPPGRQRARRAHGRAPGGEGDGGDGEGRTQRNGRRARRETRGAAASERSQPPRMPGGSANSTARRSLQLPHRARAEPRPRAPAHPCVSFRAHGQTARRHAALPMSRSLFASSLVHLWSTLPPFRRVSSARPCWPQAFMGLQCSEVRPGHGTTRRPGSALIYTHGVRGSTQPAASQRSAAAETRAWFSLFMPDAMEPITGFCTGLVSRDPANPETKTRPRCHPR